MPQIRLVLWLTFLCHVAALDVTMLALAVKVSSGQWTATSIAVVVVHIICVILFINEYKEELWVRILKAP